MRVIAGRWRRRALPVAGTLRPTPDRVRETLFNWLREAVAGAHCLDLFAGTGALGFEAASRGAKHVVMVERERDVAALLQGTARTLDAGNVEVVCADALAWRPPDGRTFDIVFLDPPYAGPAPETALDRLDRLGMLAPPLPRLSRNGSRHGRRGAASGVAVRARPACRASGISSCLPAPAGCRKAACGGK